MLKKVIFNDSAYSQIDPVQLHDIEQFLLENGCLYKLYGIQKFILPHTNFTVDIEFNENKIHATVRKRKGVKK